MLREKRRRRKLARDRAALIASDPYAELRTSKLRLGDPAPAFELPLVDVDRRASAGVVRLTDHLGRRPVVLVFGSYSCPRFRKAYAAVEALARRYSEKVAFLVVYGREAHPASGDERRSNLRDGLRIDDPVDLAERVRVACECADHLSIRLPLAIDGMDDQVTSTYGGRPTAASLIGASGELAYQSPPSEIPLSALEDEIRRELERRSEP